MKSPEEQSAQQKRQLLLLSAGAVLATSIIWYLFTEAGPVPQPARTRAPSPDSMIVDPPVNHSGPTDKQQRRIQRRFQKEVSAGVQRTRLARSRKGPVMRLRLQGRPQRGCEWGDLDLIRSDMRMNGKKHLLVSVEPLDGIEAKSTQLYRKTVRLKDIARGQNRVIPFAPDRAENAMAIYLCSADRTTERCGHKTVAHYAKIQKNRRSLLRKKRRKLSKKQSKIYYAQALIVTGDQQIRIPDQTRNNPRELLSLMKMWKVDKPQQMIRRISTLRKRIGPLAAKARQSRLVLHFTYQNQRCTKALKRLQEDL